MTRPRAAMWLGAGSMVGLAMVAVIALASLQAFVVLSQQSADNTRGRLSLLWEPEPEPEDEIGDGSTGVEAGTGLGSTGPGDGGPGTTGAAPTGTVGADEVVSIEGIRVHHSIADNVQALLTAAAEDGIALSGWGWRDGQTQIRLRRQHCGTTEYAIYQMPSSQCRPPTARPGRSQHERGLAIDFTYNGRSMSTRDNTGFRWLEANAAAYGFKNLPSEPWHWSTTGR